MDKSEKEEDAKIKKIREAEAKKAKDNIIDKGYDYFIVTYKKSEILDQDGKGHFNVEMFNHTLPEELVNIFVGLMESKPILEPLLMQALAVRKSKQKTNVKVIKDPAAILKIVK